VDLLEGGLGRLSRRGRRHRLGRHRAFIGDIRGFVLLVSLIVDGLGVYRLHKGKGSGPLKAALVLSLLLLAAYLVAVWAMAGKPG
jgi:hypothetical protein